jgi:dTDP-4-amino-4,6-dideoxygalactose transaminase
MNPHKITAEFESAISKYTGAPYCVCVDNESNALSMALTYVGIKDQEITIPSNTYPSVACEIILAGGRVKFNKNHYKLRPLNEEEKECYDNAFLNGGFLIDSDEVKILTGEYRLEPTNIWDSALTFTANMFRPGQLQCLSFTGQWKILKTIKGGAILTDSEEAYKWFKKYRFSGRGECSYHEDTFESLGKNYTMPHVLAAIGLQMITGFYNLDGTKKEIEDISLPYPDLSKFSIYTK